MINLENVTDLQFVLIWIDGMGAPAIINYVLAQIVEYSQRWHKLPKAVKTILPMLASVLLSLSATWVLMHPEIIAKYQNIFALIVSACLAYIASQKSYKEFRSDPGDRGEIQG